MPSESAVDKRARLLEHYKSKPEYEQYVATKSLEDPFTPRVCLPKRQWETEMYLWRTSMRCTPCKDAN